MFEVNSERYGATDPELELRDERAVSLSDLLADDGTKILYTYDFGDSWDHELLVERTLTAADGGQYPACLAGEGACPPEDCGGSGGYERLREILADRDPEHEHMLEWLGVDDAAEFTPSGFDLAATDEALRRIGR
jgi:hypothetical protein